MFEIQAGQGGTVKFVGRLDAAEADAALERLNEIEGPITADCAELDYISSAGLGILVQTYKRLHKVGHSLKLVNLPPRIRNVFRYARLDGILQIE